MSSRADRERLAVLVHELRSPVAALAVVGKAIAEAELDDGTRRRLLELAVAACRGIERVVTDATATSVRLEDVDVAQIAREAAAAAELGGAHVRIELPGEALVVRADPIRLRQAVDNLIENAVVHGGTHEELVVAARSDGAEVVLSVTDAGPGVPPLERDRIFESGVRLNADRPGSGLGLALARAIAEAHGGRLELDTTPERGASFVLALPSGPGQPATAASSR